MTPSGGGSRFLYRIDQPNVKQTQTEYPTIRFQPGDVVSVQAGGCVQTGGHGSTWKRYVNPSGDNSDRLYHGLIWIPGITMSLQRIGGYLNRPLTMKGGCRHAVST